MSKSFGFKSAIILATESYLMLPVILWVIMWLQTWLAVPIVLGMMYVGMRHAKLLFSQQEEKEKAPGGGMWIVYALIAFLVVFFIGLDGRVLQSWDLIYRNAIYSELIVSDWPLVMPDGKVVMYALMFWLPPALVSKCLVPGAEMAVLQCWCYMGALLMLLNLHGTLGLVKTILLVVGMGLFVPLAGMVDDALNVIFSHRCCDGCSFSIAVCCHPMDKHVSLFYHSRIVPDAHNRTKAPIGHIHHGQCPVCLLASYFSERCIPACFIQYHQGHRQLEKNDRTPEVA